MGMNPLYGVYFPFPFSVMILLSRIFEWTPLLGVSSKISFSNGIFSMRL